MAVERSKGEGRGHTSITAGTENPFSLSHGWNCSQALSWCQVTAKVLNTSSANKAEAQGRQYLVWSNPEPLCPPHLWCEESRSYRSSTPLSPSCPWAPALQVMSKSSFRMVVQQLFKSLLCLQLSSLSLPSPEQIISFSSFGFTSFQNKTFKRAPRPPHLCWLFQIYLDKLIRGSVRTNQFWSTDNLILDWIYEEDPE